MATPLLAERASKDPGVGVSQEPKTEAVGHSSLSERHGNTNEQGTAQERQDTDGCLLSDMPPPLREAPSRRHAACLRFSTTEACQKLPGF
jgi:hypothetical protein